MQMSHYLMKRANLHKFLVQKSKHWMMSVSKFLFINFFDILESKVFTEGILGILFLS